MAMDGVALSLPPNDAVDRANYCRAGEPHMRRMATGAAKPELSGRNDYAQQIPYSRQAPLWGGGRSRRLRARRVPQ
eukprot:7739981-Pyramimonas_sp.AAC.1